MHRRSSAGARRQPPSDRHGANMTAMNLHPHLTAQIDQLQTFLHQHRRVLVLTGAGLSTASGIPDYRDKDGVRRGRAPIQGPDFRRDVAVQRRYWGRIDAIITQNVDGLHYRAGSRKVIELHGNIHGVVCLDCRTVHPRDEIQAWLARENPHMVHTGPVDGVVPEARPDGDAELELNGQEFHMPVCAQCGGALQPDVIFFGDNIPAERTARALALADRADALLVVGSSLMVFSGYRFCKLAAAAGKPIAAINLGKTRADELIGLKVEASAIEVLPMLL